MNNWKTMLAVAMIITVIGVVCIVAEITSGAWWAPVLGIGIGIFIVGFTALLMWLVLSD